MSDEMEKQSVDEVMDATENADNADTTETVAAEEKVAEVTEAAPAEEITETADEADTVAANVTEMKAEVSAEPPVQESASERPAAAVGDKAATKKSKKLWIVAAAAVVLILVIANAPKIGNAAVKLFSSPAGYLQHLLKNASDDAAEQFAKGYDMAMESMSSADDMGSEAEFGITLGEDVRELLGDATNMDFDWMEKLSFLVNTDSTKDAYKFDMGFALNDNRLISLVLMANMTEKMAYMQVPELNETYLGMDLEEFLEENGMDMDDINEVTEMYEKIYEAMPKAAKVEKVLKRYSDLAISCIEDVEQDKEEVTVGEFTNKLTVLEATIDEKTLQNMLEVIVKELKEDKDIKEIMYSVVELDEDADADEVYDEFLDALDDAEDEIDELDEEDIEIVLKLYVDNEGNIMGCVVEVDEANVEASSLMTRKGSKYAYEFEVKVNGVKAVLEGEGKLTSSKLDGEFKVKAAGLKILEFTLEDIRVKELEDGYFNGIVRVSLGSAAVSALEEELYDFPFELDELVLELKEESSKNKSDATISLYEDDKLLGAFSVSSKTGKADKIKSPKDKEVTMVEDEDDLMDWVQDIDVDAFLESLEGKVDDDLLDMLEDLMSGDISLPGLSNGYDDYYYDDDYWYDEDYYYDDEYWYDEYEDDWY